MVAGGGTGGITISLAEQVRQDNAEILYLDFSSDSMKICQERTKLRKLRNIIFISDWIESLNRLGLCNVDYIQSSGVLHHLKVPSHGLKVLKDILKSVGGLSVMVYGKTGRIPLYQTQNLLKTSLSKPLTVRQELKCAKSILNILPKSNWLRKMHGHAKHTNLGDDGELYDRYLHKRDISFSSLQIIDFVSKNGLYFIDYAPSSWTSEMENDKHLNHHNHMIQIKAYARHENAKRNAILELVTSNVKRHNFYTSNIINSQASLFDTDNIVYIHGNPIGFRDTIMRTNNHSNYLNFWFSQFNAQSNLNIDSRTYTSIALMKRGGSFKKLTFPYTNFSLRILRHLLQSSKSANNGYSIKTIYDFALRYKNKTDYIENMFSQFNELFESFRRIGVIILRSRHIERHPTSSSLSYYMFKPILK